MGKRNLAHLYSMEFTDEEIIGEKSEDEIIMEQQEDDAQQELEEYNVLTGEELFDAERDSESGD